MRIRRVRFGDNDVAADIPSNANCISSVYVAGPRYNAIRFEWGHDNAIREATIADSDSSGSDADGFKGLVYFGNDTSGNRIGHLVQPTRATSRTTSSTRDRARSPRARPGWLPRTTGFDSVTALAWSVAIEYGLTP